MKIAPITLAVVFLCSISSLMASDQQLPEENLKLAGELVEVMHLDQGMFAKMQSMQGHTLGAMMTNASPQTQELMQKSMQATLSAVSMTLTPEKIRDICVSVYASVYSTEELRGAIDFYRSPVGQKWIEKQPQATAMIMARTMEMIPSFDAIKKSIQGMNGPTNAANSLANPSYSPEPCVAP